MKGIVVEKLTLPFDRTNGSSLSTAEKDSLKTLNLERKQLIVENSAFKEVLDFLGIIAFKAAAETIAIGLRTDEEVIKGWMETPGHRENILTPEYTHIGIGYDKNGNCWTQQFIQK